MEKNGRDAADARPGRHPQAVVAESRAKAWYTAVMEQLAKLEQRMKELEALQEVHDD